MLPCISPFGNILNELYGVSEQNAAAFCPRLNSGQHWRSPSFWVVNDAFDVILEGFVPASPTATPLEEFKAKFAAVKYVIDPGTPQEKIVVFPNDDSLFTGPATPVGGSATDVLISPITLGEVHPLSVGAHELEVRWVQSAKHCDGVGGVLFVTCLPGTEFRYVRIAFEVTPGHF